jgi:hypothetical protein
VLRLEESCFAVKTKYLGISGTGLKVYRKLPSQWHRLIASEVSQDNGQNCASSEDTDPYFPTVEEILASRKNPSGSTIDISERVPVDMDTDTCLPGSNATSFGRMKFVTSKGMYSRVFQ